MAEYLGLCASCKNAPKCEYLKIARQPVLQCAEFQGFEFKTIKETHENEFRKTSQADDSNEYMGLCQTCENRETCKYPKPEGGVWHCDEFK
jgi:hypothetical protein